MLVYRNHYVHLILTVILALLLALFLLALWTIPVHAAEPPTDHWHGEYYNNLDLGGPPVLVRDDAEINFDWGWDAPADNVNAEQFSVRWTRSPIFEPGTYRFVVMTDDGVRLWVNSELLINNWDDHGPASHTREIYLSGGPMPIRMEYYENSEYATAQLSWMQVDFNANNPYAPENYYYDFPYNDWYTHKAEGYDNDEYLAKEWRGEYFDNRHMGGSPEYIRYDADIDFDWGDGSPKPSRIDDNNFSVRWTNERYFSAGRYRFDVTCDDGIRLYVDGELVMDEWHDMPAMRMTKDVTLNGGIHEVRLEYYEHWGDAVIQFDWNRMESKPLVGNMVTCAPPLPYNNAWVKVY